MIKRNYKSDFKLTIPLTDAEGREVLFPKFDLIARFWTVSRAISYEASCLDGKFRNAAVDSEGRLVVYFDDHGLPPGRLHLEFAVDIPDEGFADGFQRVESTIALDVELVRGRTQYTAAEVEATVPVIIRSALESEALAFGEILDKINRRLESMLGSGAGDGAPDADESEERKDERLSGPVFLQRGIISIGAMPGVVYRNLGYIKLPVRWTNGIVTGSFDVSGVNPEIIRGLWFGHSGCIVLSPDRADGVIQLEAKRDDGRKLPETLVTYNPELKRVYFRFDGVDTFKRPALRLMIRPASESKSAEYLRRGSDGVIGTTGTPYGLMERREPAAPAIPKTVLHDAECLLDIIKQLFKDTSMVEVQAKRKDSRKRKKWRTARSLADGTNQMYIRHCGVARVRYGKRGTREASRWSVFSFKCNCNKRIAYVEPLE